MRPVSSNILANFHNGNVVAPLKRKSLSPDNTGQWNFHNGNVVAPLKHWWLRERIFLWLEFPQRKRCGPIEAIPSIAPLIQMQCNFHNGNVVAPLKLHHSPTSSIAVAKFPQRKRCGPIEARSIPFFAEMRIQISTTETLWPHWSCVYSISLIFFWSYFHNGNVVAPLKQNNAALPKSRLRYFHNGNVVAPLKRRIGTRSKSGWWDFHNGNVVAPLKRDAVNYSLSAIIIFPQRKRCGPIEALLKIDDGIFISYISTTETLRPHWSNNPTPAADDVANFHNGNVVAPLKRFVRPLRILSSRNFHNGNVVAPLKPESVCYHNIMSFYFHNGNVVAPLKLLSNNTISKGCLASMPRLTKENTWQRN